MNRIPETILSVLQGTRSQLRMKKNQEALKAEQMHQQELFHQEEQRRNAIFELKEAARLKGLKEPPKADNGVVPETKTKCYGFTLTLPPSKWGTFAEELEILNRSLGRIKHLKSYKTKNFFACHEKMKNGHLHSHAILEVDLTGDKPRYPRTRYWIEAHGCGDKAVEPEGGIEDEEGNIVKHWKSGPLAFHRYIAGAGKTKFGFFGTPWMS